MGDGHKGLFYGPTGLGNTYSLTHGFGTESIGRGLQPRTDSAPDTFDLNNPDIFASNMWQVYSDAGDLLLRKHAAYGPSNIANAPGGPENGLRVRMHDKMARLNHILDNPNVDTNDESLNDTIIDLLNYCAIFVMVRRGEWPTDTRN